MPRVSGLHVLYRLVLLSLSIPITSFSLEFVGAWVNLVCILDNIQNTKYATDFYEEINPPVFPESKNGVCKYFHGMPHFTKSGMERRNSENHFRLEIPFHIQTLWIRHVYETCTLGDVIPLVRRANRVQKTHIWKTEGLKISEWFLPPTKMVQTCLHLHTSLSEVSHVRRAVHCLQNPRHILNFLQHAGIQLVPILLRVHTSTSYKI